MCVCVCAQVNLPGANRVPELMAGNGESLVMVMAAETGNCGKLRHSITTIESTSLSARSVIPLLTSTIVSAVQCPPL